LVLQRRTESYERYEELAERAKKKTEELRAPGWLKDAFAVGYANNRVAPDVLKPACRAHSVMPFVTDLVKVRSGEMAAISKTAPRWRERLQALKNIPPVLSMVWEAAPKVIVASVTLRIVTALLPLAVLKVTQVIIDDVYNLTARHTALPHYFGGWWRWSLAWRVWRQSLCG